MFAADIGQEIIIPTGVAVTGALVAGLVSVINSWFENRDIRRRAERQLDLAVKRTNFVSEWHGVSTTLGLDAKGREAALKRASKELDEAYDEAQVAFSQAHNSGSSVLRQFRKLLMLLRRRNPASYVVSAFFLFTATFVWLFLCIPDPADDSFSIPRAIFLSFAVTVVMRVVAQMIVSVLERFSRSGAQTLTKISVDTDVATITTAAPHGLSGGQSIVVDASIDQYDGTFKVKSVPTDPNPTTFTVDINAANVTSADVTGWVSGNTMKEQLQFLFMLQGDRSRAVYVVSGLFLASVLAFSLYTVTDAATELGLDDYPQCYGEPYYGGYFGDIDTVDIDGALEAGFLDSPGQVNVDRYITFLEDEVPLWSPDYSGIEIDEVTQAPTDPTADDSWTLTDTDGNDYQLDAYGLYYPEGGTVLYEKRSDDRLQQISDPCEPQKMNLRTSTRNEWTAASPLLFAYYAGLPSTDLVYLYEGQGTTTIDAYFGRDGRFIPVCDDKYPEITPCLARESTYYDSGLDITVSTVFDVSVRVIIFAIAARLLFGLVAYGLERGGKRRTPTPSTATTEGVVSSRP